MGILIKTKDLGGRRDVSLEKRRRYSKQQRTFWKRQGRKGKENMLERTKDLL